MRDDQRCRYCEYYEPSEPGSSLKGTCIRNPPANFTNLPLWPYVHKQDRCGEFRRDYPAMEQVSLDGKYDQAGKGVQ